MQSLPTPSRLACQRGAATAYGAYALLQMLRSAHAREPDPVDRTSYSVPVHGPRGPVQTLHSLSNFLRLFDRIESIVERARISFPEMIWKLVNGERISEEQARVRGLRKRHCSFARKEPFIDTASRKITTRSLKGRVKVNL